MYGANLIICDSENVLIENSSKKGKSRIAEIESMHFEKLKRDFGSQIKKNQF
ncbi:hypothetical protein SAMN04488514_10794 [Kriegella aquimaris]|uniref:Uncharacterized protein n=1 Tax=Kriegella aquimaris TaxID=192904 RepID=A0A1G9S3Q4_9FLAO|nr:hypothetical protein SAMN04488514_10794 [Kriegella aquimaris]